MRIINFASVRAIPIHAFSKYEPTFRHVSAANVRCVQKGSEPHGAKVNWLGTEGSQNVLHQSHWLGLWEEQRLGR